ncbi:Hsp70 family protein [Micromonospora sp. NPDC049559]|uniref:Hsp70 family protein n=1 Tax=Micromonospora sp. NPDC049559 TaxID=3155923 RepID=UPI0034426056
MGGYRLGIDFGTSSTVAMLAAPDGRVKPLLFDASPLLPSGVFAGPDAGPLLTGADAERAAAAHPAGFEANPKRRIDDRVIWLAEREVPVTEAIAAVLARVSAEARRVAGGPPETVVLTHPAGWSHTRRGVLAVAAEQAQLGKCDFVAEPVAAAAYFADVLGRDVPVGRCLVVYDLGAGTCDVSIVRRTVAGLEVVATAGLDDVGGLDLDAAVVAHARSLTTATGDAWGRLEWPRTPADQRAHQLLWRDARTAKEQLSRHTTADLHLPLVDTVVHVTRDEFETAARPHLDRTVDLTATLLRDAAVPRQQIAGIFLVGGSSRVPLVASLLHRTLRIAPIALDHPEIVVAEGALHAVPGAVAAPLADTGPAGGDIPSSRPPDRPDVAAAPDEPNTRPEPEPEPVGSRPKLWPAWALLACAPVVAVVAWLVILTQRAFDTGIAAGLVVVLAVAAVAAGTLARRSVGRRAAPEAAVPTRRRDIVVTGAVILALFGAVASFAVGSLVATVLLGGDLVWDNMAPGPRIALVLCLPAAVVTGAGIWMIRRGTSPSPSGEPAPIGSRPALWPALTLLACAPVMAVVAWLMVLVEATWPRAVCYVVMLALVVAGAVTLARRAVGRRPAPRSRGLVIAGAVALTPSSLAASHEFGAVVLAPLLVERGVIVGPPTLTFLLFASLTSAAIWLVRLGAGTGEPADDAGVPTDQPPPRGNQRAVRP